MGLDIGDALDSAAARLCSSRLVRGVVSNPVFSALLITALALSVLMLFYYRSVRAGGWRRFAKMFVYTLLAVSLVIFVHFYAVGRRVRGDHASAERDSLFQAVTGGLGAIGSNHAVEPDLGSASDDAPHRYSTQQRRDPEPREENERSPVQGSSTEAPRAPHPAARQLNTSHGPFGERGDNVRLTDDFTIAPVVLRPIAGRSTRPQK